MWAWAGPFSTARRGSSLVGERLPGGFPRAAAFLQDPESGDVFQEADRAAEADFVGEAGFARGFGDDRLREFRAEQRPCARAEVGPVVAARAGTAATAAPVSCEQVGDDFGLRQRGVILERAGERPSTVPLGTILGKSDFFSPSIEISLSDHAWVCGIVQLRGAGQGLLRHFDAGKRALK